MVRASYPLEQLVQAPSNWCLLHRDHEAINYPNSSWFKQAMSSSLKRTYSVKKYFSTFFKNKNISIPWFKFSSCLNKLKLIVRNQFCWSEQPTRTKISDVSVLHVNWLVIHSTRLIYKPTLESGVGLPISRIPKAFLDVMLSHDVQLVFISWCHYEHKLNECQTLFDQSSYVLMS